jgi:hypothetical protein
MSRLVEALVAFFEEHRYCGKLDAGMADNRVWVECPCGATIVQPIEEQHVASDE